MILDNLTRAFKTQNWLAAGVEFVIVLAGVVAGFQISAWADARSEREREAMLIARLQADFDTIQVNITGGLEQCTQSQQRAAALSSLLADAPNEDLSDLIDAVGDAIAAPVPLGRSATYVELLASGEMALIRSESLRAALVNFDEQVRRHALANESLTALTFENSGILFETLALGASPSSERLALDVTERLESAELAAAGAMMAEVGRQSCVLFNNARESAGVVIAALQPA